MNLFQLFRQASFTVAALTILGLGLPALAAHPVPFKGRADVTITGVVDRPPIRLLTASATGEATHLGRFTRSESLTINLLTGTFTGTLTFTAANGDLLKADVAGHFTSPTGASAEGTYTFTGGTGRVSAATGTARFEVTTTDGVHAAASFEGLITY